MQQSCGLSLYYFQIRIAAGSFLKLQMISHLFVASTFLFFKKKLCLNIVH